MFNGLQIDDEVFVIHNHLVYKSKIRYIETEEDKITLWLRNGYTQIIECYARPSTNCIFIDLGENDLIVIYSEKQAFQNNIKSRIDSLKKWIED